MIDPVVIYEETDFLVIAKPGGLIVHRASPRKSSNGEGQKELSVVDWLVKKYPEVKKVGDDPEERPGIVHRLDRDTSGVMVVPRTEEAFSFFKNLFQTKEIKKSYLALVYGTPRETKGTIDKPIGLNSGSTKRTVFVKDAKMVKEAVTDYEVVRSFAIEGVPVSLIRVSPRTGRTHQIRVHMALIGCPVVGDTLYGKKRQDIPIARQFLHAESIEFPTPGGNRITVSADLPPDLAGLIK